MMTKRPAVFVVFDLEGHQFGLHVAAVDRVVYAVEITTLPQPPDIVLGVINVEGRVVPVINTRRRVRLPEREPGVGDQFILAHTSRREVALPVDRVTGVIECAPEEVEPAEDIFPGLDFLEGVVKRDDGLILIHDLEKFLSLHDEELLGRMAQA